MDCDYDHADLLDFDGREEFGGFSHGGCSGTSVPFAGFYGNSRCLQKPKNEKSR